MLPIYTLTNLTCTTVTESTEIINLALILSNATLHPIKQIYHDFPNEKINFIFMPFSTIQVIMKQL